METLLLTKKEFKNFQDFVTLNYEQMYKNKAAYIVEKKGKDYEVRLLSNPFITLKEILGTPGIK